MRVLLYTDSMDREWFDLLTQHRHVVTEQPLAELPADPRAYHVCLVVNTQPGLQAYRFWIRHIPLPVLLVTTSLLQAEVFAKAMPNLHIIAHPSRAIGFGSLSQLLEMTTWIKVGTITLGPLVSLAVEGVDAITTY